jgi:hypothetical protein
LRRRDPSWDKFLRAYLFTEGPITELEAAETAGEDTGGSSSLGLGALVGKEML